MRNIIAIGGGEIGRPGTSIETLSIDKEIIKASGKTNPRLLFIPTASGDSESYAAVVEKYYGEKLGCKVETLYLTKKPYPQGELERIVLGSNIIYVGGGNTLQMMKVWRKFNMHQILEKAERKGIVLSGLSAGGICWFKFGNSDSLKSANKNAKTIKVSGLNLVPGLFCPHYNVEKFRKQELKEMLRGTKLKSIALDNCTAIHIKGSEFKILKSKRDAKAYLAYWRNNKYFQDELIAKKFSPIFW